MFAPLCQTKPITNWKHYLGRTKMGRNMLNICFVLLAQTHQKLRTLPGEGPRRDEIVSIFALFCQPKPSQIANVAWGGPAREEIVSIFALFCQQKPVKSWEHYLGDQDGTKWSQYLLCFASQNPSKVENITFGGGQDGTKSSQYLRCFAREHYLGRGRRDEIICIFALFCYPIPIKNWEHYLGMDQDGTKQS